MLLLKKLYLKEPDMSSATESRGRTRKLPMSLTFTEVYVIFYLYFLKRQSVPNLRIHAERNDDSEEVRL